MSFPNLALKTDGQLHAEATGQPANGNNTFSIGIPAQYINEEWLEIEVTSLGDSVSDAQYVGLSIDKTQLTINFTQTGTDQATVAVRQVHSIER